MAEFRNIEEKVIKSKILDENERTKDSLAEYWSLNGGMDSSSTLDIKKAAKAVSELSTQIQVLKETSENYAFRPLFSNRGFLGASTIFFKRVIRKLLKWYIEPICFQQTVFNLAVTNSIERIAELQCLLLSSITEQTNQQEPDEKQSTHEDA